MTSSPGTVEVEIITRLVWPNTESSPVRTTLLYTVADPLAVHMTFHATDGVVTWSFARDLLIVHGPVTFSVMLPPDLKPGTVIEWADAPDTSMSDCTYTVVAALSGTSITFAHLGRDATGALAAALWANTRYADRGLLERDPPCGHRASGSYGGSRLL